MPIVQDVQQIHINSVTSDPDNRSSYVRTESGSPKRKVTLRPDEVPGMPDIVQWRDKRFAPTKVTILYAINGSEEGSFDEVTITGTTIRKDGKLGTGTAYATYWQVNDGLTEEQVLRIGEYLAPDYLTELVRLYDPTGEAFPFTATKNEMS